MNSGSLAIWFGKTEKIMSLKVKILHQMGKLTEYDQQRKKRIPRVYLSATWIYKHVFDHIYIVFIHALILVYMYIPNLRLAFTRTLTLLFQSTCQSPIGPVPSTTSS